RSVSTSSRRPPMREPPTLLPHVLQRVDVGQRSPDCRGGYLAYGPNWRVQRDIEAAFVFPSEALARRTAIWMLAMRGESWLPLPAAGRESTVVAGDGVRQCPGCGCT